MKARAAAAAARPAGDDGNRRGDILAAAGRLFREKGFKATTTRDIAAAVGMRSGSPFYHFKSKHDMLLAVMLDGIRTIHDSVEAAAAGIADPRQRFAVMARAHMQALLGPGGRDFAAAVLHETRALEPAAAAEVGARKGAYELLWSELLGELQAAGALGGDLALTRLLILGALNWATQWWDPAGEAGPAAIADQLTLLVLGDLP